MTGHAIAIIGAGPAGLMAAETAAAAGAAVTVFDRMPSPGRKFLLAGRGGLNITNSEGQAAFLGRYGAAADALSEHLAAFTPSDLCEWCAGLGEEPFTGASGRMFPKSFKATPLLRAWLGRLDALGARLALRHHWTGWDEDGALCFGAPAGDVTFEAAATVLALGGASWPRMGSDGAWTEQLSSLAVTPLAPANCGFEIAWSAPVRDRHAGSPLKNIAIAVAGQTVRGEAMISAYGLEGGAVYALAPLVREEIARAGSCLIAVDLKPDVPLEVVRQRLSTRDKAKSWTSFLRGALGLTPAAIAVLREAGPFDAPDLAERIKALPLTCLAAAPLAKAISTAGGVQWAALDETLMVKVWPSVFLAGEMIDWEAPTGGYLLQACFATGHTAGAAAAAWALAQD